MLQPRVLRSLRRHDPDLRLERKRIQQDELRGDAFTTAFQSAFGRLSRFGASHLRSRDRSRKYISSIIGDHARGAHVRGARVRGARARGARARGEKTARRGYVGRLLTTDLSSSKRVHYSEVSCRGSEPRADFASILTRSHERCPSGEEFSAGALGPRGSPPFCLLKFYPLPYSPCLETFA